MAEPGQRRTTYNKENADLKSFSQPLAPARASQVAMLGAEAPEFWQPWQQDPVLTTHPRVAHFTPYLITYCEHGRELSREMKILEMAHGLPRSPCCWKGHYSQSNLL